MSLAQFLKVPGYTAMLTAAQTGTDAIVYPYSIMTQVNAGGTTLPAMLNSADWYDYIMPAYALSRGSMRVKLIDYTAPSSIVQAKLLPVTLGVSVNARYAITSSAAYSDATKYDQNNFPTQYFKLNDAPVEVQMPQYGRLHSRVTSEIMTGPNMTIDFNQADNTPTTPNIVVCLTNKTSNFTTANTVVFRSCADDFQAGYFVGVPPYKSY